MVSINNKTSLEINERYQERLLTRTRNSRLDRRNTIKLPEGVDPLDISFESIFDDSNIEQSDDDNSKKQKQISAASNNNSHKLPNSPISLIIPESPRNTKNTKEINELETHMMIENLELPSSLITGNITNLISEIQENSIDSNNPSLDKSSKQVEVERQNGLNNQNLYKSTKQVEVERLNGLINLNLDKSTDQAEETKSNESNKPNTNQLEEVKYSSKKYLGKSAAVQVEERPSGSNNKILDKSAAIQVEEGKPSESSVKMSLIDSDFYKLFDNRRMTKRNKDFPRKQSNRFTLDIDITNEIDEPSIPVQTIPNDYLGLTIIKKHDSSPTALDENSSNNLTTLEITPEDQISMSMQSSNSQSPKFSDIEENSYLPLINNDNGLDGTFVLEPSFASSLAKPISILSILEKPASFSNIPIMVPVQDDTDKEVLVEKEMEEDSEENFTTEHLSDPNKRKRTIDPPNNDQEGNSLKDDNQIMSETRKYHISNVNEKVEDSNAVRKAKKRSHSKLGNPTEEIKMIHNIINETIDEFLDKLEEDSHKNNIENFKKEFELQFTKQAEIIQKQLNLHEFFNQKLMQMKKVKDDLLEVKQKREIISKNMTKERELFKKEEEDRKKLEGLHNFLSNLEFLKESVGLEDVSEREDNHHNLDLNEISGLIFKITSRTGDLTSDHSNEEGALSIIKRYNN
ncbi:14292_t:CDS:2 [Entrophospora sp. SA101]|nr:14292_t:CDS:2 [Entrophospora sp. SA101]